MVLSPRTFSVVVIGPVSVEFPDAVDQTNLSKAKQRTLAALVAAQDLGLDWSAVSTSSEADLDDDEMKKQKSAFRMAISRLRAHLRPGAIVEFGSERDRLALDNGEVDAWRLLALSSSADPLGSIEPAELLHLLNPTVLFDGVAGPELVERMSRRIRDAQRALFSRLAAERPDLLRGAFLEHLREHLEEDPYNESLLVLLVIAQAEAGNRRLALRILRHAMEEFAEVGLLLSSLFEELEHDLIDGSVGPRFVAFASSDRLRLPWRLESIRTGAHVGHDGQLDALGALLGPDRGHGSVLVEGGHGAGKTRLCAELAARAARQGMPTLYLSPSRTGGDPAFGSLLAALSTFRQRAEGIFAGRHEPGVQKAELWTAALGALGEAAGGGSMVLIVDDSQWLDSQTSDLIGHLPQSELATRLLLIVVAGSQDRRGGSESLATTIGRHPATQVVEVGLLDVASLHELVKSQRPDLDERLIRNLARELHAMTGGLAGVASLVLANLDELELIPDLQTLQGDRVVESVVSTLPDEILEVGVVASVIGLDFDLAALEQISYRSSNELLEALDQLIRRQLVRERSMLEFEIAHVLVQSALLHAVPASRVARLNRAAADYFDDDVHRRARHQAAAAHWIAAPTVLASLLESAGAYLRAGAYREAVVDYRNGVLVSSGRLHPAEEGRYARALDLSGMAAEGRRVRRNAFEQALVLDDHELALNVATSGLPEAEPVDGDAALVADLLCIDEARLEAVGAHAHACHLARQLAIVGRLVEADTHAARARRLADDPTQRVQAAVCSRFAISATASPTERIAMLTVTQSELDLVDGGQQAEYCVLQAIDHYENADIAQAERWRSRVGEIQGPLPPLRRWHNLLFDAMVMTDTGRHDEAGRLRDAAYEFALGSGIGEAMNARYTPEFVDLWLAGTHGDLIEEVDGGILDPSGSVLARAGAALVLHAAAQSERGVRLAESLTRHIVASPVSQGTAALALVTSVLAHSADEELVTTARNMLASRGRSLLVIGACAASLGPADRYVAALTAPSEERHRHRRWAVELADKTGSPLWRLITRRDLAREYHDDPVLTVALELDPNLDLTHPALIDE